jgi:two-component system chemotaxis sensor kinase CheA
MAQIRPARGVRGASIAMSDRQQDEITTEFLVEAHENLDALDRELMSLEADPAAPGLLASVFRRVHTLKGACGFLGFSLLESVAHAAENLLSKARDEEIALTPEIVTGLLGVADTMRTILGGIETNGKERAQDHSALIDMLNELQQPRRSEPVPLPPPPPVPMPVAAAAPSPSPSSSPVAPPAARSPSEAAVADPRAYSVAESYVRVDVSLLDRLMNLVGELVLVRNRVLQAVPLVGDPGFAATSQRLDLVTTELQSGVMKTRMQPIGNLWEKFPRIVRDLALACGKRVRVEMEGNDTELDKTVIEAIKDPLAHLVRNCIDHGVERPEQRAAARKPAEGRLRLRAFHESGQINIEISDDGNGMDLDAIKSKAIERRLISAEQAERMSDRELHDLIFLPGLSTARRISNVSGRGVGMDVVKTNVERIGGLVDVQSRRGVGTVFHIKIPLTLASIPALIVTTAGERYAVPQVNLLELVRLTGTQARDRLEWIQGAAFYRLHGNLLPLVHLDRALEVEAGRSLDGPGGEAGLDRRRDRDRDRISIVVLQADGRRFGLVVDEVNDTEEIVVKPLGRHLKGLTTFAGATIMGDGRVALILDVRAIALQAGVVSQEAAESAPAQPPSASPEPQAPPQALLLFTTRDQRCMAVPLSLVARLEEFPRQSLERAGDRQVVQYRGRILPLVDVVDLVDGPRARAVEVEGDGARWPADAAAARDVIQVVVCGEGPRRLGVMVGRILDIIEETADAGEPHRDPELRPGAIRQARVIQNRVTELIDLPSLMAQAQAAA